MTYSGNAVQATAIVVLYSIYNPRAFSLTDGVLRFQNFQQEAYVFGGASYPYRDWVAPLALDSTTEVTNRSHTMTVRRSDRRQEGRLPILDLCRAYDGLGGSVIEALNIDTRQNRVERHVYQIRSTLVQAGSIVFSLQCSGFDPDWPTIGGMTPTYQRI